MIESMKKVFLVALRADREATLNALRELEVIHLRHGTDESQEQSAAIRGCDELQTAIYALKQFETRDANGGGHNLAPTELAKRVTELLRVHDAAREQEQHLAREIEELIPWGNFDPEAVRRLRARGLQVALGIANAQQLPEIAAPAVFQQIAKVKDTVYFAVVSDQPLANDLPEIRLPEKPLAQLQAEQAAAAKTATETAAELKRLAACSRELQLALTERREGADFLRARDAMAEAGELVYLNGYVPARRLPELQQAAATHSWALLTQDPADDDREVPTLLRIPRWLEVSRPIFDFVGIQPGYREFDVSSWFLIFLTIFFAIIYGDGGYGALFLAIALIAKAKVPKTAQRPANLFVLFSAATVVWGLLSGNWFSLPNGWSETAPDTWVWTAKDTYLPRALCGLAWLQATTHVQYLCLLIGAVHLSIAHLWKTLVSLNSLKFLSQIGWTIMIWANFFLGGFLIARFEPPINVKWLYLAGLALILLFSNPTWKLHRALGRGFAEILGGGINSFVDVLSYIRLFAVGLSSYYVAKSFNDIGMMLIGGEKGPLLALVGMIGGVIVILFGHLLNLVLGGLGVLVHGIRLNTLEFSGHMGVEWAGVPFKAFARRLKRD